MGQVYPNQKTLPKPETQKLLNFAISSPKPIKTKFWPKPQPIPYQFSKIFGSLTRKNVKNCKPAKPEPVEFYSQLSVLNFDSEH